MPVAPDAPADARPDTRPDTRAGILAAAVRVVLAEGVARLTLDQVAREAGVSKGGLLYHFPSKEELIGAMVRHYVERFDAAVDALVAADPEPRGRWTRAYLRACRAELSGAGRTNAAIQAALGNFPDLLEPVRAQGERHGRRMEEDGLPALDALAIRLAVDGLWLGANFDLLRLDPAQRDALCDRLEARTLGGPPGT